MKKQILLLAGSALILASCGSNNNNAGQTQAQIDSTVNAKMAQHDAENAAKNDSTLKAIEAEKASAASKEHEHEHTAKHTGSSATPASPAPTPAPSTPANPKDARFNTNPDGTPKAATVDPNAPNKKADRFK